MLSAYRDFCCRIYAGILIRELWGSLIWDITFSAGFQKYQDGKDHAGFTVSKGRVENILFFSNGRYR